jgi:protein-S-isoprenylcysteine O-methyltransferase Ste14
VRGEAADVIDPLRLYLLSGLVLHKLVWEVLKRSRPVDAARGSAPAPRVRAVKVVKVAILAAILVQTLSPEVLPIAQDAAALRLMGAAMFTVGLLTAISGRLQLGDNWLDIETSGVMKSQRVVQRGLYRVVRHPIYTGDLILLIGLELALNSWFVLAACLLVPVVTWKAVGEEKMLARSLPGYAEYCRQTKRFVPYVI